MTSWKKPTQKQIELVLANLKGNLIQQFFAKLENPEWFEILKEQNLLEYSTNTNDYGQEYKEWVAFPYLLKIASEIPNQIMQFIQPMLQKIKGSQNPDWWLIQQSISLSTKLPDRYFIEIMNVYNESLKKLDRFGWQDDDILKQVLTKLKTINKTLALDICRNLLSIKLTKDKYSIGASFSPYIKIANSGYGYEQIIKIVNTIFSDFSEELLDLYVSIIAKDMIDGLSKDEIDGYYYTDYIHRSAIEKHVQDIYKKSEPLYILVSEIRDRSFELIQNGNANSNQNVFDLLESSNCPTMTRIILYLLRVSDRYNNDLLVKYLTNREIFDNSTYHHEYYLLIQEKFNLLSIENQNIILDYIDKGPKGEYYETDDQSSSEQKKSTWRLHKLTPIKKYLSQDMLDKYRAILYNDKGEEVEYSNHPDMLFWVESGFISSPLNTDELSEKTVEEIVEFIISWKSDDTISHKIGLAENLRNDSISNPNKYLNCLEKLKAIEDPTYIHYILSGLRDAKTITNAQWQNIIEFSQWIVEQNSVFENRSKFHDGDSDWQNAKAVVADLLSKAFRYKENLKGFTEKYLDKAFAIFKKLCFTEDKYLEKKVKEEKTVNNLGDYLTSAINSLHGKSVEGLVLYLIWSKNNNKPLEAIATVIDELFKNPKYLETYAIFAHMLPWIHYALPTITENNIDNLFPEDSEKCHLFEATFATFVDYSQIYNDTFHLLKSKFIYVLENQIYSNNEQTKTEDSQVSKFLAICYGRGLFDLDSEIIKLLFNDHKNYQKQMEFINYIGFSMWDRDNPDRIIAQEVIDRFVKFWEWLLQEIKGEESKYTEVLSQFERWYQCNQFDEKWVIDNLHNLVVSHNVPIQLFMIEDNLLRDLPKFPRKIFDIISRLIISSKQRLFLSNKLFIEELIKYIFENDFPEDNKLKLDKDVFINKYLENCEGWQVDMETEKLSRYLEPK